MYDDYGFACVCRLFASKLTGTDTFTNSGGEKRECSLLREGTCASTIPTHLDWADSMQTMPRPVSLAVVPL